MRLRDKYTLEMTCGACPEAYDVFLHGREVGYMRLRHGNFTVEAKTRQVYSAKPDGDGLFDTGERDHYIFMGLKAINELVDPEGDFGRVDPDEQAPEIKKELPGYYFE